MLTTMDRRPSLPAARVPAIPTARWSGDDLPRPVVAGANERDGSTQTCGLKQTREFARTWGAVVRTNADAIGYHRALPIAIAAIAGGTSGVPPRGRSA